MLFEFWKNETSQSPYSEDRFRMVKNQLERRDITDEQVLKAFQKVPRHLFVPEEMRDRAYADYPLPIGEGQTISQPYIVALMTQSLKLQKDDKVLEIGTGSGYQTAILAELGGQVYTVEVFESLSRNAQSILEKLGYENVNFKIGDGTLGWEEYAPYQKIIGTGSAPKVPGPLLDQLNAPGKFVIPVGSKRMQELLLIKKDRKGNLEQEDLCPCSFIQLKGKEGW